MESSLRCFGEYGFGAHNHKREGMLLSCFMFILMIMAALVLKTKHDLIVSARLKGCSLYQRRLLGELTSSVRVISPAEMLKVLAR